MSEDQPTTVDLDEIQVMGDRLPNGTYDVKIIDILATTDSKGRGILRPTFEVTQGEHKGLTHQSRHLLHVFPTKKGGTFCPGVTEIKRDAIELGVDKLLPRQFPLDPADAKRAYHKAFKGVRLRLLIQDGKPQADGTVYKEARLLSGRTPDLDLDLTEDEENVY